MPRLFLNLIYFRLGFSFKEFVDYFNTHKDKNYSKQIKNEVIIQKGKIQRTEENKYRLEYLPLTITKNSNNGSKFIYSQIFFD